MKIVISPGCGLTWIVKDFRSQVPCICWKHAMAIWRYIKEVFTDPGYVPYNFNDLDKSEENLSVKATRAKSNLFKAHAAELDVYAKK